MEEEEPAYQAISQSYADCESLCLFSITPASPAGGAWPGAARRPSFTLYLYLSLSKVTTDSVQSSRERLFTYSGQARMTGPGSSSDGAKRQTLGSGKERKPHG